MGNSRRRGLCAAIVATAVTLGAAATAGAAESKDVYVLDSDMNHLCFTTDAAATTCPANGADVAIAPGETVTWHFDSTGTFGGHNAADADHPTSPTWKVPATGFVTSGTGDKTFDTAGVYKFFCQAHQQMKGTVTVGTPPPPPDDPPPDDNPPPSSPPPTGTHPVTPAPTPGTDTVRPSVRKVKLKALRRAVRVRFRLSEPATVTVRAKRGRKVVVSKRVQASAGTHTVTLRSKRLTKGRYVVQILARDAYGNRSKVANKRLALRR